MWVLFYKLNMKNSTKMKLIVAAIILVIIVVAILIGCDIISSLSFGSLIVVTLSFLIGMGVGAYIYKIYKQLKSQKE